MTKVFDIYSWPGIGNFGVLPPPTSAGLVKVFFNFSLAFDNLSLIACAA